MYPGRELNLAGKQPVIFSEINCAHKSKWIKNGANFISQIILRDEKFTEQHNYTETTTSVFSRKILLLWRQQVVSLWFLHELIIPATSAIQQSLNRYIPKYQAY